MFKGVFLPWSVQALESFKVLRAGTKKRGVWWVSHWMCRRMASVWFLMFNFYRQESTPGEGIGGRS